MYKITRLELNNQLKEIKPIQKYHNVSTNSKYIKKNLNFFVKEQNHMIIKRHINGISEKDMHERIKSMYEEIKKIHSDIHNKYSENKIKKICEEINNKKKKLIKNEAEEKRNFITVILAVLVGIIVFFILNPLPRDRDHVWKR
jgi:CHASE3 domain sensor protein